MFPMQCIYLHLKCWLYTRVQFSSFLFLVFLIPSSVRPHYLLHLSSPSSTSHPPRTYSTAQDMRHYCSATETVSTHHILYIHCVSIYSACLPHMGFWGCGNMCLYCLSQLPTGRYMYIHVYMCIIAVYVCTYIYIYILCLMYTHVCMYVRLHVCFMKDEHVYVCTCI